MCWVHAWQSAGCATPLSTTKMGKSSWEPCSEHGSPWYLSWSPSHGWHPAVSPCWVGSMMQDGTPQTKGVTTTKMIMRVEMLPLAKLCQLWSLLLVVYQLFYAVKTQRGCKRPLVWANIRDKHQPETVCGCAPNDLYTFGSPHMC